jgi:hypothetical protein
MAGLDGDWAAHSLRSGFVTEAGRQGVPLGEVMAMTEHRSVSTVMGYFQAGALLDSRASKLLGSTPGASEPHQNKQPGQKGGRLLRLNHDKRETLKRLCH